MQRAVQLGVHIFWQMAHTKYGKRSLKHLVKIWDNIYPSLHDSSPLIFEKQHRDVSQLSFAYDDR